ncbi:MAG: hypothetical protein FVQ81_13815 [Candidatus Glassbacteria bacterium]|nr:hypothetical protein [Candidatus Glassbacteria bacterium]
MRLLKLNHVLSAVLLAALPALCATVEGKVTVPVVSESPAGAGGGYSRGVYRPSAKSSAGQETGKPGEALSFIIVWAEPLGKPAQFKAPAKNPAMIQRNKTFVPHVLPVQSGTTVDFPNLDPLYHNVFSYSRARRFDLGLYEQGKSKSVTFDQPGIIDVFCEIHESMHAYVLVLETPWFTRASADGMYSLELPAGDYRICTWIPSRHCEPVEIKLIQSSREQVDFSF